MWQVLKAKILINMLNSYFIRNTLKMVKGIPVLINKIVMTL
jgi:hypothetical protein